ncbi:MAG: lanthionine synthetase LanC family protein [Solirubrobacterales bacterium]
MTQSSTRSNAVPIDVPEAEDPVWRLLERQMPWATRGKPFSVNFLAAGSAPSQGWKVHVSATPWSAVPVLERALPVILEAGVSCKVVNTRLRLLLLNNGRYGPPQAGKFITLYPSDEDQAVRIALALHEATDGLPGPRIATDRPLRPRSLVHYRYGVFSSPSARSNGGGSEIPDALGGLRDGAGRLLPDRRELDFVPPPPGVSDPFEARGAYVREVARKPPLGGRYLIADVLATSACGGVYQAVDVGSSPPRACVLKEYWRDAGGDFEGRLAPAWGMAEADLLARHAGDPYFPEYLGRFELDGNLFVALEYFEGRSLAAEIENRQHRAAGFSPAEIVRVGIECARALAHFHEIGLVYRDCSPANLIGTPSGGYRLVDFGIAHEEGGTDVPRGLGTLGYCSPQQWAGGPPSAPDDVYSWGAVMHCLVCAPRELRASGLGADGARGPVERESVVGFRHDFPDALASVIDRALRWETADRYPSMTECLVAFERAVEQVDSTGGPEVAIAGGSEDGPGPPPVEGLSLAREVGDALCESAIERDGGLCWASGGDGAAFCSPDVYHGAAGIALFLAELGGTCDEPRYLDGAEAAARWMAGSVWASGRAEPGLYCGESGVGWFFLRLAELTGKPGYAVAAELRARRLRGVHLECLDLNDGAAGLVVFLVRLGAATGDPAYLREARDIADLLVRAARPIPRGAPGCHWPTPARAGGSPGAPLLGLAHGAAGIALALVELAAATDDERALGVARAAAELLLAEAQPHPDGGWCWRESLHGDAMRLQGQCHGAIGVGQFFLRLARLEPEPAYLQAAEQAALTAARELPHRAAAGICHGLAGDGHLLLECENALDAPRFRESAFECAAQLQRLRDPDRPGSYISPATGASRPDLLTGDAGVGSFYLRLASGDTAREPVLG